MNLTAIANDAKRKLAAGKIGNVYMFETDLSDANTMRIGCVSKDDVEKSLPELKQALERECERCKGDAK